MGQRTRLEKHTMIEDFINMLILVGFTTAGIVAGYWARGHIENEKRI